MIEQQTLLQQVRRENEQRSLDLQQVSANCQQLLQQQKRQDAFVFRVAYKRSGKPFFDVKCLVCRGADKTTMLGMYLDLTNKGFHCAEHRQKFHSLVPYTWSCCDHLDPQDQVY